MRKPNILSIVALVLLAGCEAIWGKACGVPNFPSAKNVPEFSNRALFDSSKFLVLGYGFKRLSGDLCLFRIKVDAREKMERVSKHKAVQRQFQHADLYFKNVLAALFLKFECKSAEARADGLLFLGTQLFEPFRYSIATDGVVRRVGFRKCFP